MINRLRKHYHISHTLYPDRLVVIYTAHNILGKIAFIWMFIKYISQWLHPKCKRVEYHLLLLKEDGTFYSSKESAEVL